MRGDEIMNRQNRKNPIIIVVILIMLFFQVSDIYAISMEKNALTDGLVLIFP